MKSFIVLFSFFFSIVGAVDLTATQLIFSLQDGSSDRWDGTLTVKLPNGMLGSVCAGSDMKLIPATLQVVCSSLGHAVPTGFPGLATYESARTPGVIADLKCPYNKDVGNCTYTSLPRICPTTAKIDCGPRSPYTPPPVIQFKFTAYPDHTDPFDLKTVIPSLFSQFWAKAFFEDDLIGNDRLVVSTGTQTASSWPNIDKIDASFTITEGAPTTRSLIQQGIKDNAYYIFNAALNVSEFYFDNTMIPFPPVWDVTIIAESADIPSSGWVRLNPPHQPSNYSTLCYDNLQPEGVAAICRASGFHTKMDWVKFSTNPDVDRDIREGYGVWWKDLSCVTDRFDLCTHQDVSPGDRTCTHDNDVFVNCYSNKPTQPPPEIPVNWTAVVNASYYGTNQTAAVTKFFTEVAYIVDLLPDEVSVRFLKIELTVPDPSSYRIKFRFLPEEYETSDRLNRYLSTWLTNDMKPLFFTSMHMTSLETDLPIPFAYPDETFMIDRKKYHVNVTGYFRGAIAVWADGDSNVGSVGGANTVSGNAAIAVCAGNPEATSYGLIRGYKATAQLLPKGTMFSGLSCTGKFPTTLDPPPCTMQLNTPFIQERSKDLGVVCPFTISAMPHEAQNLWVANIKIEVTSDFDWDKFKDDCESRFDGVSDRMMILDSQLPTDTTNGWYKFFIVDVSSTGPPRQDLEFFFVATDPTTFIAVTAVSYVYDAPQYKPTEPPFIPTDTTGWVWKIAGNGTKGLLEVKPTNQTEFGHVCYEKFNNDAAHAICLTITTKSISRASMYVSDTSVQGKMFAGNFICPTPDSTSGVGGCRLDIDTTGNYPCGNIAINSVYLDCSNSDEYQGFINFTVTMKTADLPKLAPGMNQLVKVPSDRLSIVQLRTSGNYSYYSMMVKREGGVDSMVSFNSAIQSVDYGDLFETAAIYEFRSDLVSPKGNPDPTAKWTSTIGVSIPLSGGRGIGPILLNRGDNSMLGMACGMINGSIDDFSEAIVQLCIASRYAPENYARLIRNIDARPNVIYFSDLSPDTKMPWINAGKKSDLFVKTNDCSSADVVGAQCGTPVRPPPAAVVKWVATVQADKISNFGMCLAGLMDINASQITTNSTVDNKIEFSFENDDNAAIYGLINMYKQRTVCGVQSVINTVPYAPLTTTQTTIITKPQPPTEPPWTPGPTYNGSTTRPHHPTGPGTTAITIAPGPTIPTETRVIVTTIYSNTTALDGKLRQYYQSNTTVFYVDSCAVEGDHYKCVIVFADADAANKFINDVNAGNIDGVMSAYVAPPEPTSSSSGGSSMGIIIGVIVAVVVVAALVGVGAFLFIKKRRAAKGGNYDNYDQLNTPMGDMNNPIEVDNA